MHPYRSRIALSAVLMLFVVASAHAGSDARLRVGDAFPAIESRTLDDRAVVVPGGRHRPVLLLMGFVKDSRDDVKKWTTQVQQVWRADSSFDFFEMPMVGSGGRLFAGMITGSMRGGTPADLQAHVMPLYRDAGLWQKRLGLDHPKQTVLVVLDREGKLAWQASGPFSDAGWKTLEAQLRAVTGAAGSR
jgi:hypothetical protein